MQNPRTVTDREQNIVDIVNHKGNFDDKVSKRSAKKAELNKKAQLKEKKVQLSTLVFIGTALRPGERNTKMTRYFENIV